MSWQNRVGCGRSSRSHNIFGHLRCPELYPQLWLSLARHACVAAIAALLLRKEEKSILLFCVPVDTGRIGPQMFHLQQLLQNNALWIFNNQAPGKLIEDRSKPPRSLVRLRRWLQKREGKTRSCVLRGRNRLCYLLKSQSCHLPTDGLHLPHHHHHPCLPLSLPSFLCAHLTRALKEQQQLFNLERYCPTEGFAGNRPSSMLSSHSQPVSMSHSIFQSKLGMPAEQLLSPKPLFCNSCKIRK